jgi:hypothetical protein
MIQAQECDGRSALRGEWLDERSIQSKMSPPALAAWMK